MLLCRVLGPLEVEVQGVKADLGGPLPRRLLSALLSAEGKPMADATLGELVWEAERPAVLSSALQVTVSRLRSSLGPAGRPSLMRTSGGYRFRIDAEQTDAGQFAARIELAGEALASGNAERAVRQYTSALRLWRGRPWTELPDTPETTGPRVRLNELREVAVEELQAARLGTGDAAGAVAALSEAVAAAPYRERRWELLVLGLYRSGRQGHALAELRRVRELLAEELGVDPGPGLRQLEQRLLNHDPRLLILDSPPSRPGSSGGASPQTFPTRRDPDRRDPAQPVGPGPTGTPALYPAPPPGTSSSSSGTASSGTAPLEGSTQLGRPGGPPPVPAGPAAQARLPRPLSSFIGRQAELALLAGPLAGQRLVSLLGPAGVGKTRLALEHLAGVADLADTWLVRLADIAAPEEVALSVAAALGVGRLSGDPVPAIQRALAAQPGLLVLDNCEHLVDSVGELAMALLSACPRLRILTTSREPLGLDGEHIVAVRPLAVTGANHTDGAAVALLVDRVRASRPGWQPSAAELVSARQICVALDGLPLAIELAAARERALGLAGVAAHLRGRFAVLGAPPRGSLTAHATLHAAIEWSVDLLGAADRAMLLRLWPFEGGFSWQAAEAVQPPGAVGSPVLATLASLVDRSVVLADTDTAPARYRLLETVRSYCREADPDPAATQAAHAVWVRAFAAEQINLVVGPRAGAAFRALSAELPNLRAGIAHDLAHRPVDALRTTAMMEWLWPVAGILPEGRQLIEDALRATPDADPSDHVQGLLALALVAFHAGDPAESVRLADTSLKLLEETPDDRHPLLLKALMYRSAGAVQLADVELTRATAERLVAEAERQRAPGWIRCNGQLALGAARLMDGRREEGAATLRAAREDSARCGYLWGQGTADLMLAWDLLNDPELAEPTAHRALRALRRALEVFLDQSNSSDVLGVLYAGAHALPAAARAVDGARLRAAVLEHAERTGAEHRRYVHLAGAGFEQRLDLALTPAALAGAEGEGRALSWSAMLRLFQDAQDATASVPPVSLPGPGASPRAARA
ncbi:MAG TPA: BTAD domain-containing putative transcriptional regulator [Pseudonocardia sp.]|nr:BTAD domain-containing putative transcriptional regulator [Pseudonocardia sp.]